jgi:membrane dipeptidase
MKDTPMIVIDAHEDIAYNALCFGRDYRHSAWETRRLESGTELVNGRATVGLPDALLGRVALVFATLFVAPRRKNSAARPWDKMTYSDPDEAYRLAGQQLDYYNRLADETGKVRLVKTTADLDAVLGTWGEGKDLHDHQQGLVILMENADPILEPEQFAEWYERGVRLVGPAWQATRYAGGTGYPGPLTRLGYQLLDVMAGYNAILDLSHLAEKACFEALDHYPGPIIASHTNPRRFRDSDRHLPDDAIRQLAERDGVMGIVLYNAFLSDEWTATSRKTEIPLSRVLDIVDYVCQLTGSAAHVGLGSDFDGGFGAESIPDGLETVTDLWHIGEALRGRGYNEEDIAAILGGNMLRKLRQSLPEG